MSQHPRKLRMGMVGGGKGAFIGAVHRAAARLDGEIDFVAAALSATSEKAIASGRALLLPDDRNYPSWRAMLEGELRRGSDERIDFVSIVTPNDSHAEIAAAFLDGGFHVVVDKPMTARVKQAEMLKAAVARNGRVLCVTYTYSGYPMVKQARTMVQGGELGPVRKIVVQYEQGWLAERLEEAAQKQAAWRADPAQAGPGGASSDIGAHAEQLVRYITGFEIDAVSAHLRSLVRGRRLDDDANVMLRLTDDIPGVLIASQACTGERNHLRIRVWGDKAGLEWSHEKAEQLVRREAGGSEHVLHRGDSGLCEAAALSSRLPAGHPEGFIEAFANIYRNATGAMRSGKDDGRQFDYPDVHEGARGVRFIAAAVESSRRAGAWLRLSDVDPEA